ncbi:MAG TPA: hypothetical protein VF756_04795 [Thermoanaerobaculia bacterium]
MKPEIVVVESPSITEYRCDVLVLKHAQEFYGADEVVAGVLRSSTMGYEDLSPVPGSHVLVDAAGKIAAREVLFVGVVPLRSFRYPEIREFGKRALQILAQERPKAENVAMTIHGVGYGLDERESFLSQIGGMLEAIDAGRIPPKLKKIAIVERNSGRYERLRRILEEMSPTRSAPTGTSYALSVEQVSSQSIDAGTGSERKPHIFVAMPYDDAMEDVYVLGIQEKVNAAGFLCERIDMTSFIGDILERIKTRIESASLVIADLSGGNANVYLEVGYAWGKGRPTLLLAKTGEELKFDVRNQRCIQYKNIVDLRRRLENELTELKRREGKP